MAKGKGDCAAGKAGDSPWVDEDGKVGGRIGCFLDENGTANVRVTCGPTYVGILGRDDDIAALVRWVRDRDGEPTARRPSGDLPLGDLTAGYGLGGGGVWFGSMTGQSAGYGIGFALGSPNGVTNTISSPDEPPTGSPMITPSGACGIASA